MNKPHWQKLHDCWQEDFHFWLSQRWLFVKLRRKHPENNLFLREIKGLDKVIKVEQGRYRAIYGSNLNLVGMRKDIENEKTNI